MYPAYLHTKSVNIHDVFALVGHGSSNEPMVGAHTTDNIGSDHSVKAATHICHARSRWAIKAILTSETHTRGSLTLISHFYA